MHAVLVRLPGNSESQSVSTAGPPSELEYRGLGEGAAPGYSGASGSRTLRTVLALVFAVVFGAGTARAQQTLFNVPSADVLDKGKTYVEVDDLYGGDPDVQVITIRGVQGLGGRVEAGVNLGGFVQPGRSTPTIVPNVKWQPYRTDTFFVTTGALGLFYLRGSKDGDPAALVYSHVAWRAPTKTRLTAGAWAASDGYAGPGAERGGLFGFEQPLGRTLTVAADWFTGKNGLGYFTPGVFVAAGAVTIYAGYSIKNGDSKGNGLLAELGVTF